MKNLSCFRRYGMFAIVAAQALVLGACKETSAPLVPGSLQVVAGNQQTVTVGATVPTAPSVKVLATNGQPMKGVTVTFTPAAESGTVTGGTQVTDALGVATVTSWKLGTKAGVSTLNVSAPGVSPLAITVTTSAGAAASLKVVSGDNQTAVVGAQLSTSPQIRVVDAFDNAIAGTTVSFTLANGGTIERTSAQSDANGVASPGNWMLGTKSGAQILSVTSGALSMSVTATANADVASQLAILTQPSTTNGSGGILSVPPTVEFRDRFNNTAAITAPRTVTASLATGTGTLGGTTALTTTTGRVTFGDLTYTGTGNVQLRFTSNGFADAISSAFDVAPIAQCAGPVLAMNYTLGQITRYVTTQSDVPRCLDFSKTRNAGQQYLVLFENISPNGSTASSLFDGSAQADPSMSVNLRTGNSIAGNTTIAAMRMAAAKEMPAGWDMGGTWLTEGEPRFANEPARVKHAGEWISANSTSAPIAVGDTVTAQLVGISWLAGVRDYGATLDRKAIVKYVDANIVIAEDVRIVSVDSSFQRLGNNALNTPLTVADLQEIASEYSKYAKPEADRFFNSAYNSKVDGSPGRPIAVHTLMYQDGVWGYTYSNANYFAFDYWAGTNGKTKGFSQQSQRVADHLFMHEIAHMRHYGLVERAGRASMGHTWLVEGFARSAERLSYAMRQLNVQDFSRTQNVVLPFSTGNSFLPDEIPPYWYASASLYGGYQASSYVFDYFADQVAGAGGDWWKALQELVVAGSAQGDVDGVVNRYLGYNFGMLFTRARVALYTDDIGTPGLPSWTQYLMYQLRASRTVSSASSLAGQDPRILWPKILLGATLNETRAISPGGAFGYVVDGTTATTDMRLDVEPTKGVNGIMSIIRIK